MADAIGPKQQIRRFDIFAEWNRLKGSEKMKLHAGDARAYGLAVAKVVAGRKQRREAGKEPKEGEGAESDKTEKSDQSKSTESDERWWEHLGSDAEFKKVIVNRMGAGFYKDVFTPAVRKAWEAGKDYKDIRDTLREPWNKHLPQTGSKARA